MKSIISICFFVVFSCNVLAEVQLKVGGSLESNLFVGLKPGLEESSEKGLGTYYNYRNSNSFNTNLKIKVSSGLSGFVGLQIRNVNFSTAFSSNDLEQYNALFPVSFRLNELYIDFNEMVRWFDLRVGQQRIAWGKATAFNPTDNLNPYNLENPLDFTTKLPVPAIKMTFYLMEELTLTIVGIPYYTPSILPISLFREVTASAVPLPLPTGAKLGVVKTREEITYPAFQIENTQAAARLAGNFGRFSFSGSYFFGRLNIPVPEKATIETFNLRIDPNNTSTTLIDTNVLATLVYPRMHVVGLDFSVDLWGVGLWGEFALNIPLAETVLKIGAKDKVLESIVKSMVKDIPDTVQLEATPYLKATVGLDYTFKGGWYFNLQYVHGFFNEITASALNHYLFLVFRKPFLRGKMIVQITAGGEMDQLSEQKQKDRKLDSPTAYAFLVNPEIQFKPFDSSQITVGGIVARGHTGTTLALFQDLDQVYVRFRMDY